MPTPWKWDASLFAGSARHYSIGRMAYPPRLAQAIRDGAALDGTGRLLDVGCGPGSLTLLLAPYVAEAVGVDADPDMLTEAARTAALMGVHNLRWRHLRAEDLPADIGTFRVVTFAQSFHWMDQELVAARVRRMLTPDGFWLHVFASTARGVDDESPLPFPQPPWNGIDALVASYLGPTRRAGQSCLPDGTRSGEEDVMRAGGFTGPERIEVRRGEVVDRGLDEVVSAVFSLSSSAPHLFGERLAEFEDDLRRLLTATSPTSWFSERTKDIEVVVWRP